MYAMVAYLLNNLNIPDIGWYEKSQLFDVLGIYLFCPARIRDIRDYEGHTYIKFENVTPDPKLAKELVTFAFFVDNHIEDVQIMINNILEEINEKHRKV